MYITNEQLKMQVKQACMATYGFAPAISDIVLEEFTHDGTYVRFYMKNGGQKYVFISDKSVTNTKLIERSYISDSEKRYYKGIRTSDAKLGADKVKLARVQYRGQGHYIDEILK